MNPVSASQKTKTVVGNIDPDVLSFTVGKDPILDLNLVAWDCYGSAAHVTMLTKMPYSPRLFSIAERNAVVRELAKIASQAAANQFTITEADQDCHLAIERTLTEKLGDLGRRIHTGRSRNDQVATALRLYTRDQLLNCLHEIYSLAQTLTTFAEQHQHLPMVGRTHLQPAMPSSVGLWASCYAEGLLDDATLVEAACHFTNRCPLGSAASYGVPLPTDREFLATALAFDSPIHNVLYAGNSRGKTESVVISALTQPMLTLSRLAEDLIIFTLPEFNYFSIPKEFCTGSSIMPQKYNPDVCELIRAKAAKLVGLSTSSAALLKAMAAGYNRDLQDTKEMLMDALDTTRTSLRILRRLVQGLTPNPEALRRAFTPGVFATDRALELVAGGMPFRDAYHQVRNHLEDLASMDPDEALAAKTHLGATAGLNFKAYQNTIQTKLTNVLHTQTTIQNTLSSLMGPLPE